MGIKTELELKGKLRAEAYIKTLYLSLNFNDKSGSVNIALYEDQECRDAGIDNDLERRGAQGVTFTDEQVNAINTIVYEALMESDEFKDGVTL